MAQPRAPLKIWNLARRVAEIVRSELGPGVRVLWFGSWVDGTAVPRSDLDIAIAPGAPIAAAQMLRLQERIEELPTLYQIDLVDLDAVGDRLRKEILEKGVEL